jgi:hypothetical protein
MRKCLQPSISVLRGLSLGHVLVHSGTIQMERHMSALVVVDA